MGQLLDKMLATGIGQRVGTGMAVNAMMLGQGFSRGTSLLTGAGAAMGGPAGMIGGAVLAGLGNAAVKTAEALEAMRTKINEVSQELQPYSGALTAAAARREVATINQNVRNADRFGNDLAAFQDSQTRIVLELQNMKTSLVGAFAKGLQSDQKETSQKLAALLGLITKFGESIAQRSGELVTGIADSILAAGEKLPWGKDLATALKNHLKEQQEREKNAGAALLDGFLEMESVPIGVQNFRGSAAFWATVAQDHWPPEEEGA